MEFLGGIEVGPGGGQEDFLGRFFESTVGNNKMLARGGLLVEESCWGLVGAKSEDMRGMGRGGGCLEDGVEFGG